jgi:hypothetical protein
MGHYDLDYEYDNDKNSMSDSDFRQKWGNSTNKISNPFINDDICIDIKNITNARVYTNKEGTSKLILDKNGIPSYTLVLDLKTTNYLLSQILLFNNVDNK